MKPIEIFDSAFQTPNPGTYRGTFRLLDDIETKNGKAYRWVFDEIEGGSCSTISGLSDREARATIKNKTGRWLSALAGQSLAKAGSVNPDSYFGKRYALIVDESGKLDTFTKI